MTMARERPYAYYNALHHFVQLSIAAYACYYAYMVAIVLGSTGYTGELLLRLLARHPHVEAVYAVSQSRAGEKICIRGEAVQAAAFACSDYCFVGMDELPQLEGDVLFSALPHLRSAAVWKNFVGKCVIVDLAADMRVPDDALFRAHYGQPAPVIPDARVAYGIPEIYGDVIASADIIANPGCFPTAALIPLMPLVQEGVIQKDIVINAITGISGAGKSSNPAYLFSSRTENVGAYGAGTTHRHWAELCYYLRGHSVLFTPHLAPLSRGIACTTVCRLRSGAQEKDILYSYAQSYSATPFIHFVRSYIPQTADVRGSNRCDYGWQLNEDGTLILFSVIDNLLKGASGQAIQNMNIRMGFDERAGLPCVAEL